MILIIYVYNYHIKNKINIMYKNILENYINLNKNKNSNPKMFVQNYSNSTYQGPLLSRKKGL